MRAKCHCKTYVKRGIWYEEDAAHIFLVGVIALVLVAVCNAYANWRVVRGVSKQPLAVWAYVWADTHIYVQESSV